MGPGEKWACRVLSPADAVSFAFLGPFAPINNRSSSGITYCTSSITKPSPVSEREGKRGSICIIL